VGWWERPTLEEFKKKGPLKKLLILGKLIIIRTIYIRGGWVDVLFLIENYDVKNQLN